MVGKGVDIGFVEDCESWKLESRFFPSKVGGKPAWLDLEQLPSVKDLECCICNKQLLFLCQIYAPYEEDESNFHRMLFVFVCRTLTCLQNKELAFIKVFRSHLKRYNKFYSSEPPEETPNHDPTILQWVKLCSLCGCLAQKHCSKCNESYCSREHQVVAWKEGHKLECNNKTSEHVGISKMLFNEYELVIEPETVLDAQIPNEKEQIDQFLKLQEKGETGILSEISETDLEQHISVVEDKTFANFQKRIGQDSEQVIRYQRGGDPLWIAKEPIPDTIPDCEYCLGPRQFEFQIMPQMLVMLAESELDWGVVCIYTCKNSCTEGQFYKKEFVFKQDVVA